MTKIPVSEKAAVARLRRVLRESGRDVRQSTPLQQNEIPGLGKWFLTGPDGIESGDVDVEALCRELHVIRPWETIRRPGGGS